MQQSVSLGLATTDLPRGHIGRVGPCAGVAGALYRCAQCRSWLMPVMRTLQPAAEATTLPSQRALRPGQAPLCHGVSPHSGLAASQLRPQAMVLIRDWCISSGFKQIPSTWGKMFTLLYMSSFLKSSFNLLQVTCCGNDLGSPDLSEASSCGVAGTSVYKTVLF